MRIAVFGAGGVGGFFGGRLAEAGERVSFIARGEHLTAIRRGGLRLEGPDSSSVVVPELATDDPREIGEVDVVLLGVKAWQVREAAEQLGPMLGAESAVLPLQNGVEAVGDLVSVLGPGQVLGGTCKVLAFKDGPGVIRFMGVAPTVALGELSNEYTARVERLAAALERAAVEVTIPESIERAIWEKFVFISSVGAVGAAWGRTVGELRSEAETRGQLEAMMEEIRVVAAAEGVELPRSVIDGHLAFVDTLPADGTASLQRDLAAGRPSELDAQAGAVVRLGRRHGVPTPVAAELLERLLARSL